MLDPPTGTVTFLFTDIEGSTQLVHRFGDRYTAILAEHRVALRDAFVRHNGYEVNTDGDAFFVVFSRAGDAIAASVAGQQELSRRCWPENAVVQVRMGLHTGEPICTGNDYTGLDVHRAARIAAAAHGGQILLSDAARMLVAGRFPNEVSVRDLGEHRLKDLAEPEHLFQVIVTGLRTDFPPIRSLNNCPNNLPAHLAPLIGREEDFGRVCELIRRPDVRLICLTGPPGVGKTLLALHTGTALLGDFADGTFAVDLSDVAKAELVSEEIAVTLGVGKSGDYSVGAKLETSLITELREKRVLLILDSLERATEPSKVIAPLIENCPYIRLLVTSRKALRVRGEYIYDVAPLPTPQLTTTSVSGSAFASPAVTLFVERAKTFKGDFALNNQNSAAVAEICRLLDGLPLAIELAAARVKLLSPLAMLGRLVDSAGHLSLQILTGGAQDLPRRQQTFRATIGWSYDLLEDNLKSLFCQLSVFCGGCAIAAAERVCTMSGSPQISVLDGIAELIANNLLCHEEELLGEPRVSLLHTIREFGLEQLRRRSDCAIFCRAHAEYFAAFVEEGKKNSYGNDRALWTQRVDAERENIASALDWSFKNAPELAVRLTAGACEFWFAKGHWTALRDACESVAELNSTDQSHLYSECMRYAGRCAKLAGDTTRALQFFKQGLALAEQSEDDGEIFHALSQLGHFLLQQDGAKADARACFVRAFDHAGKSNDDRIVAETFFQKACLAEADDDIEQAHEKFEEAFAIFRRHGDQCGLARCASRLARVAISGGEYERGLTYLRLAEDIHARMGEGYHLTWDRFRRGLIAYHHGEVMQAQTEFQDTLRIFQDMKAPSGEGWSLYQLGRIAHDTEDFSEASGFFERALSVFRVVGSGKNWALLRLGTTAIYEGRFRSARKLFERSLDEFRRDGVRDGLIRVLCEKARLARLQGEYDTAGSMLSEAFGLAQQIDSKRLQLSVLQQLAYLARARTKFEACGRLHGKIGALREEMQSPLPLCDRLEYHGAVEACRSAVGSDAYSKALAFGSRASFSDFDQAASNLVA